MHRLLPLLLLLATACGSLQPTTRPPTDDRFDQAQLPEQTPPESLDGVNDPVFEDAENDDQVVTEEDVYESPTGPYLPPVIPPTRYEPYIRRADTPAPPRPRARNTCQLAVEVRNYDGVDECGILLETDSGYLMRAGLQPRGKRLEAGTRISIGFEYMADDGQSSCTNVDAVIRITCIKLLRRSSGIPRPIVCESYDTPAEWLLQEAKFVGATYVTRFPWKEERFVYLVESPEGQYLYDCRGYLICQPRRNCLSFIDNFSDGQIIYEN